MCVKHIKDIETRNSCLESKQGLFCFHVDVYSFFFFLQENILFHSQHLRTDITQMNHQVSVCSCLAHPLVWHLYL